MPKVYNDKLNTNTRKEMIAAIFYLLECCDSKENASRGQDFLKYAKEKFGLDYIDRRRATPIFNSIYELSEQYKDSNDVLLPFVVHKKQLNSSERYYIEKKMLSEKEVADVLNSLTSNNELSKDKIKKISNKLIKLLCTKKQANEVNNRISKVKRSQNNVLSDEYYIKLEQLEDAAADDLIVHFKLQEPFDAKTTNYKSREVLMNENFGRVFCTSLDTVKTPKVVIYINSDKHNRFALVTDVDNVILLEKPYKGFNSKKTKFILDDCEETDLDEWVNKYYSGTSGFKIKITFKFVNAYGYLDEVEAAYCKWFKKDSMPYTLQERKIKRTYKTRSGEIIEREPLIVQDCVVSIDANVNSFKNFYMDNNFWKYMVILEPKTLNDELIGTYLRLFANRLTKYGGRFDYELIQTMKPEYQKKNEELMARIRASRENITKGK